MGLLGVPVRIESKLKEEVCDADVGFFEWAGSSLIELVEELGTQADVASVGRILLNMSAKSTGSRCCAPGLT
jgi:hypothetical protein